MKIIISGASGLIGTALRKFLSESGHEVSCLVRSKQNLPGDIYWDPYNSDIDPGKFENCDAMIHLSGANLATIWSEKAKKLFRESRIDTTSNLCKSLTKLSNPPGTLLSASAVGYYGDGGNQLITEENPSGSGFLAELCRDWENATHPASEKGIRVVNLRTGLVLSKDGGVLPKMLPAFKLGAGGNLGSGGQMMSWITLRDEIAAIEHILSKPEITGPVNLVAPNPVSNRVFTRTLAGILHRPAFFNVPAFVLRTLLGEMAEEMLLSGQRVQPVRLTESGFAFSDPELEDALKTVLGIQ